MASACKRTRNNRKRIYVGIWIRTRDLYNTFVELDKRKTGKLTEKESTEQQLNNFFHNLKDNYVIDSDAFFNLVLVGGPICSVLQSWSRGDLFRKMICCFHCSPLWYQNFELSFLKIPLPFYGCQKRAGYLPISSAMWKIVNTCEPSGYLKKIP